MTRTYVRDSEGRFAEVTDKQRAIIKRSMRQVYKVEPAAVKVTRKKHGDAAANAQLRAIGMDLAIRNKGVIPKKGRRKRR